ncbi:MAG: hypothetical protein ABI947_06065 [Chloroflexota bacterium]
MAALQAARRAAQGLWQRGRVLPESRLYLLSSERCAAARARA